MLDTAIKLIEKYKTYEKAFETDIEEKTIPNLEPISKPEKSLLEEKF